MNVPDATWFDPLTQAVCHTGSDAIEAVKALERSTAPHSVPIAMDIETPGLSSFTVNCVTAAWRAPTDGRIHVVLLDPRRDMMHEMAMAGVTTHASELIFHNAPFDVPILHAAGWIDREDIDRVIDTLVLARLAFPSVIERKTLEALVVKHLGLRDFEGGMAMAFKAAGYPTISAGYAHMDIDSPIYRMGAMADTVMTLRLEPIMRDAARHTLTDHPFPQRGATCAAEADYLIGVQEQVHRVMLRRSARGLAVDLDYLDRYAQNVDAACVEATKALRAAGLIGGAGQGPRLVAHLDSIGELDADWPRTPTGKLKATKELLDTLEHPLARAQRTLAANDRVRQYLNKVRDQAAQTGRCHPQCNTLGASQTGRMSYSSPEIHQFSAAARPIIVDDGQGLTSIDWSQIEPVTMALLAGDTEFLAPFESGADLYEPIQRAAGVKRDTAKIVLLAAMYGQGVRSLARKIGHTVESATQVRRQMFSAMPKCARWISQVQYTAETHGMVVTAGGRILPVGEAGAHKAVNHVVQGSAYDILAHTIVAAANAGLGDAIQIAMHDEVVVDSSAATAIREIMCTAPDFLRLWAGRDPVLRTDVADLGHAWAKV